MKWLIIKLIVWWQYRIWQREVRLVDSAATGHISTSALLGIWDNAPCIQLIKIVPRAYYSETLTYTVTENVSDLRKWLTAYLATIKRYNALTPDELENRPGNTYLDIKEIVLSDRMEIDLDQYMRNMNGSQVTHKYLIGIMDLIREIDVEISKISDPYNHTYFLRRGHEVMKDVWLVQKSIIEASRHYEPEERKS